MVNVEEYARLALDACVFAHKGAFYGQLSADNTFGAGVFCGGLVYPMYDPDQQAFDVVEGPAYILTHECDIDADNDRSFSDLAVVCPVIPLENFVSDAFDFKGEGYVRGIIEPIARNIVNRVFYLPPHDEMIHGALMYLNNMVSTHVDLLRNSTPKFMLSDYGMRALDRKLENHFFREKADPIPRTL